MKKNQYFEIGDIVDMHCGEQGIVVEILDNTWVLLLQCNGHIEKAHVNDIWFTDSVEQNGKKALHEFFMKTVGYSSILDEDKPRENKPLSPEDFIELERNEKDIPF